jgi:hypothetical protein
MEAREFFRYFGDCLVEKFRVIHSLSISAVDFINRLKTTLRGCSSMLGVRAVLPFFASIETEKPAA